MQRAIHPQYLPAREICSSNTKHTNQSYNFSIPIVNLVPAPHCSHPPCQDRNLCLPLHPPPSRPSKWLDSLSTDLGMSPRIFARTGSTAPHAQKWPIENLEMLVCDCSLHMGCQQLLGSVTDAKPERCQSFVVGLILPSRLCHLFAEQAK